MDHHVKKKSLSSSPSSSSSKQSQDDDMNATMEDLRRGPWTDEEDHTLSSYISKHGEGRWNSLARCAGLNRTGKSCRLRWLNYLRPDVRRGNISLEEQLLILELHSLWGNRWSKIVKHLPGRTDNEIKNYWRTRVQKQAKQLKCDVNSQQFKDSMRHVWMPRLVERIQAASAADTNNNTFHGSAQITAVPTTDQTQHGCINFTSMGGYEPYGPFSSQVSPISGSIDDNRDDTDFSAASSCHDLSSEYQNISGYGDTSLGVINPMEYECTNLYGQQLGFNGYDEWMMMMMQNGVDNVDDFWFNGSEQLQYQQQQFTSNNF